MTSRDLARHLSSSGPNGVFRFITVMVHLRLNETEPNPNPHVNFITALPMPNSQDQEEARQLLRALAAQVRPVMKAHGLVVNSLEEVIRPSNRLNQVD